MSHHPVTELYIKDQFYALERNLSRYAERNAELLRRNKVLEELIEVNVELLRRKIERVMELEQLIDSFPLKIKEPFEE